MSSSTTETPVVRAETVTITGDEIAVELSDGRSIFAPLAWYPRLLHGTPEERSNWRRIGGGVGIHWPALDEDISVGNCSGIRRKPAVAEAMVVTTSFVWFLRNVEEDPASSSTLRI
jgi:hypothetical protein